MLGIAADRATVAATERVRTTRRPVGPFATEGDRGMAWKPYAWMAVGCLLLPGWLGCVWPVDRHGVILRGDWSLELNRVPWLGCPRPASTACCESECSSAACAAPYSAAAASVGTTPGQVPQVAPPEAPDVPDPPPAAKPQRTPPKGTASCNGGCWNPFAWRPCPVHGRKMAVGEEEHIHSRFSPVPTQPAFYPRNEPFQPIVGGPFPQAPRQPVAAQASVRPQELPPPRPIRIHTPEPPEEIPQAPLPPRDRETQSPRRISMTGGQRSLVFAAPPDQVASLPRDSL